MIEQEEVILMTKLALHEKKYGKKDKKRSSYFKWDYIYINNWYTRFAVGVVVAIVVFWMTLTDVYVKEIIPVFEIDLGQYLSKYILAFIGLILIYTGISTAIFNRKYENTQDRLREYDRLLKELDRHQNLKQSGEEDLHGTI
ncbi:MAG TPA: hypothetical protein GX707_20545 [Epulopiscium sp.]|nr:hypothetical protein [Candidatus Epulonipiscium sp.]